MLRYPLVEGSKGRGRCKIQAALGVLDCSQSAQSTACGSDGTVIRVDIHNAGRIILKNARGTPISKDDLHIGNVEVPIGGGRRESEDLRRPSARRRAYGYAHRWLRRWDCRRTHLLPDRKS